MRDKSNPKSKYTRGRPTSRRRSEVSKALVELRHRLGHSQQSLAERLGVALQTVARWETVAEPQGYTLHMLLDYTRDREYDDLTAVFEAALAKFKLAEPRIAEEIETDIKCWFDIQDELMQLEDQAAAFNDKDHPFPVKVTDAQACKAAAKRIQENALKLMELTERAKRLAWRNR